MSFKIEKGIQAPEYQPRQKYPFSEMEVNDSFFIKGAGMKERKKLSAAACTYGQNHNKVFTVRSVDGGVRIWRVK